VSVEASQSVRILLGNGTGAFTGSDVSVSGVTSIAAGDLNGDGKLDLAAVKQGLDVVSILLGNGLGGFTEAAGSPIAVGVQPRAVGVGDWNEDGRLDVAVGNQTPKNVTILLNTTATALGGSACDDGNECTVADTCDAWTCAGDPVPDGAACDDDNTCTSTDNCESGACVGADPEPEGSPCDDLNGCTQQDVCQSGACRGASPVVCTASDQCHVVGTCNAAAGVCSNPAKANGTACNDVNACTQTDTCQSGTCTGANPVVCTASDPCHAAGICNPGTAVCSNPAAPDGTGCNDGNACTTGDACSGGACGGTPGSPPAEVDSGVRLARSGSDAVISWQLAAGATSSAVLRGLVGALPVGPGGGDETCLAGSLPSTTLSWPDSLNPASGSCFWYLIRGDNACGHGSYGLQGVHGVPGAPRVSTTCP